MSCLHLESKAHRTAIDETTGLCGVCSQIFSFYVSPDTIPSEDDSDNIVCHFHIGPFRYVSAKAVSCSGCRLILGAIWGSVGRVGDEETLKIERDHQILYYAPPTQVNPAQPARLVDVLETLFSIVVEPGQTSKRKRAAGSIIRNGRLGMKVMSDFRPGDEEACSLAESLAGDLFFRGREVPATLDTDLLKGWLHRCNTEHENCLLPDEQQDPLFKSSMVRLIDVEERKVIMTAPKGQEYVALSYVWGKDTKGILTKATLEVLSSPCSISEDPEAIPKSILDAMRLVRDIGLRYLWVDSLCIIQDDNLDRVQRMAYMGSIYSHASLVVIAASGKDAHAGLPGVAGNRKIWQYKQNVGDFPLITAQPWVAQAVKRTTWNTRGWTFQEAALARRTLVFTENQVYWNCQKNSYREDMTCEMVRQPVEINRTISSLWGRKGIGRGSCPTLKYCDRVTRFSEREFKDDGDALWAFDGIFASQSADFPKGFIWGTPYEILDTALLWTAGYGCGGVQMRESRHEVYDDKKGAILNLKVPSWSWLSQRPVDLYHMCEEDVVSKVSWHRPLFLACHATPNTHFISPPGSTLFSDDTRDDGSVVRDYGLLRFTARTAKLDIRRAATKHKRCRCRGEHNHEWVNTTVHDTRGRSIGILRINAEFLEDKDTRLGECVVLSANVTDEENEVCKRSIVMDGEEIVSKGNVTHVGVCEHVKTYNIMLVEWDDSGHIAKRVGLGEVKPKDWENLEICEKHIVLM
ncbi:heterokaryon incompatibility protein-domain-containing protein [Hypoxylon sp. FL1150]|nr:heterokaryon incompatibility protein-domain-containing protein [Hypoxylon sp. FL1150]